MIVDRAVEVGSRLVNEQVAWGGGGADLGERERDNTTSLESQPYSFLNQTSP